MRITKDLIRLEAAVDALRKEREQHKNDEYQNAKLEYYKAVDAKLLGKCFIWKWDNQKDKKAWYYIKFIDRTKESLRSVEIPYLIDKEFGAVSFSNNYISTASFAGLKPISEERFQAKLTEAFEIILSASKRSNNGNA